MHKFAKGLYLVIVLVLLLPLNSPASRADSCISVSSIVSENIVVYENNTEGNTTTTSIPRTTEYNSLMHEISYVQAYLILGTSANYTLDNDTSSTVLLEGDVLDQYFIADKPFTINKIDVYIHVVVPRRSTTTVRFVIYKILAGRKIPVFSGEYSFKGKIMTSVTYDGWYSIYMNAVEGADGRLLPGMEYMIEYTRSGPGTIGWYAGPSSLSRASLVDGTNITNDETMDFLAVFEGVIPLTNASGMIYLNSTGYSLSWDDARGAYYTDIFVDYGELPESIPVTVNFDTSGTLLMMLRVFYYNMTPLYMMRTVGEKWITYNTTVFASAPFAVTVETDWDVTFIDPHGEETAKLLIKQKIFGREYLMVKCIPTYGEFFVGDYIIIAYAPNYIEDIQPSAIRDNQQLLTYTFYPDENVKLEVYAGYNGTFNISVYLDNEIVWSESKHVEENWYVLDIPLSNISISGLPKKLRIEITWYNATQYGDRSIEITVIPPPTQIPVYLAYGAIAALGAVLGGLYIRHWLQIRNWEEKLKMLYVFTPEGNYLWSYGFKMEETFDPILVSNFLSAITSFMQEAISGERKLDVISQEKHKIILSYGRRVVAALLAEKYVPIIKKKLDRFREEFEKYYANELERFSGDITVFNDALVIVHKVFPKKVFKVKGSAAAIVQLRLKFAALMHTKKKIESAWKEGKISEAEYRSQMKKIQKRLEEYLSELERLEKAQ